MKFKVVKIKNGKKIILDEANQEVLSLDNKYSYLSDDLVNMLNSLENENQMKKLAKIVEQRISYHFGSTNNEYNIPNDLPFMKEFLKDVNKLVREAKRNYSTCYIMHRPADNMIVVVPNKKLANKLYDTGDFTMRTTQLLK